MTEQSGHIWGSQKAAMQAFGGSMSKGRRVFVVRVPLTVERPCGIGYTFGKVKYIKGNIPLNVEIAPISFNSDVSRCIVWQWKTNASFNHDIGKYLQRRLDQFKMR
ncbi:hypothetical protein LCGC14_0232610 [marine sediment metagenome]|uniref:Uncharacterized protein n=1 Tax=marine sediment metagenome TaxID=412755 RepID=A0A0F9UAB8_9ZZZZ